MEKGKVGGRESRSVMETYNIMNVPYAVRIEIRAPHPIENRYILIGKIEKQLWSAIYTLRGEAVRIISVRRSKKQEMKLYEQEKTREEQ